eukprot:COSAG02_NODE_4947_length_4798_cov_54.379017_2_plen_81_part_00
MRATPREDCASVGGDFHRPVFPSAYSAKFRAIEQEGYFCEEVIFSIGVFSCVESDTGHKALCPVSAALKGCVEIEPIYWH